MKNSLNQNLNVNNQENLNWELIQEDFKTKFGKDVFESWLKVNINGFGLGSNLYKPGMLVEEVKLKAQNIVKLYDNCIRD